MMPMNMHMMNTPSVQNIAAAQAFGFNRGTLLGPFGFSEHPVPSPSARDICFGRGKGNWAHPGNLRLKEVIKSFIDRYVSASSRLEKSTVIVEIVETVRRGGCRFLKKDSVTNLWYDVDEKDAREKIAHGIRDFLAAQTKVSKKSLKAKATAKSKVDNKSVPLAIDACSTDFEGNRSIVSPLPTSVSDDEGSETSHQVVRAGPLFEPSEDPCVPMPSAFLSQQKQLFEHQKVYEAMVKDLGDRLDLSHPCWLPITNDDNGALIPMNTQNIVSPMVSSLEPLGDIDIGELQEEMDSPNFW